MACLLGRFRLGTLAWLATLGLGGCLVDDPNHCANRSGDTTCQELEGGGFCSICSEKSNGCVAERPAAACYVPVMSAEDTTTTGADTETSTDTDDPTATTGPAPECSTEGLDPSCPEETPYCVEGMCSTCDAGPEALCGSIDPQTPICHPGWGQCVSCIVDADCEGSSFCDDSYACGGCTQHEHCPDSACDLRTQECFSPSEVYWVDSGVECPGFGTDDEPYCSTALAMEAIGDDGRGVVKLLPGNYDDMLDVRSRRKVAVVPASGRPVLRNDTKAVRVTTDAILYLAGVDVRDAIDIGIDCTFGGRLWLDQVVVTQNAMGMYASNCKQLVTRRSQFLFNSGDAITLEEGSNLKMLASTVVRNGTATENTRALRVHDSTFELVYTSVVDNLAAESEPGVPAPRNILCNQAKPSTIRNSVVVANDKSSIACTWLDAHDSVIDTLGIDGDGQVVVDQVIPGAWFVDYSNGDVHVRDFEDSPLRGTAAWELGDPRFDLDDGRRAPAPGTNEYAGADQP